MTLAEFKKKYDGAPFSLEEFAEAAKRVTDCDELAAAAAFFLYSKQQLEDTMWHYDVEPG